MFIINFIRDKKKIACISLFIFVFIIGYYFINSNFNFRKNERSTQSCNSAFTYSERAYTNNSEKLANELYFKQIPNVDQLYFFNLVVGGDLEAVTHEHTVDDKQKLEEWQGTINIYEKQEKIWVKTFTYKLTPQLKGDSTYFSLRGGILSTNTQDKEILIQDSSNGSGLFTKFFTLKHINNSYLLTETPIFSAKDLNGFGHTSCNKGNIAKDTGAIVATTDWQMWSVLTSSALGLSTILLTLGFEILKPFLQKRQRIESLKKALCSELLLNIDLLFSGEVESVSHFDIIREIAKNNIGDIKDMAIYNKIQILYSKLEYYQRFVSTVYLNPEILNFGPYTTEKQLQTCNVFLEYFLEKPILYDPKRVLIQTDQGNYIDQYRDEAITVKISNYSKWKLLLNKNISALL